jgi:hypothetical protein
MVCAILGAALLQMCPAAGAAEAAKFETELLPSPVSDLTAPTMTGDGTVSAVLDGNKLEVSGTFNGLGSPATDAHLFMGTGIGIPGSSILDLAVPQSVNGTVSGTFTLNRQQIAALRKGHLYVQIDTQKAGMPYGNLWGWLLPDHPAEARDVPQEGHWFQPQYDVPR